MASSQEQQEIHFVRINAVNVYPVCALSDTLSEAHRKMVAQNAVSIAQGSVASDAWYRAIYSGDEPVGFIMVHYGSDHEDDIDCPGAFLWRLMIAGPHQGKGYGRRVIELLCNELTARGYRELFTSCGEGEGSPEGFYAAVGFARTGGRYDDENEMVLRFPDRPRAG